MTCRSLRAYTGTLQTRYRGLPRTADLLDDLEEIEADTRERYLRKNTLGLMSG